MRKILSSLILSIFVGVPFVLAQVGPDNTALNTIKTSTSILANISQATQGTAVFIDTGTTSSSASSATLYTVPAGKTLYITSASLALIGADSAGAQLYVSLQDFTSGAVFVKVIAPCVAASVNLTGAAGICNETFPQPITVAQNDLVKIINQTGGANVDYMIQFTGYYQ